MEKINIALVGCGRIAYKHFQAIEDNNECFNLVAVCDTSAQKADEAAEKYNVSSFTDMELMLTEQEDIDVVAICTPSGLHPEHSMLASKFKKHVVTEKPMSCHVQDAKAMINTAQDNDTKLFVVKQNRLNPTVVALKEAIDAGKFGKIYMVQANVFWTRPQAYYSQAPWRGTWKYDGGAFMNQASHYVDLLEYLVGPVAKVQAMTKTLARDIEAEDSGVINLEWENGAIGSMSVTMLTYPKNLEGSITILGEKGTVRLDGVALNEVKHWLFEGESNVSVESLSYQPDSVYGNGHGPYYKNVADVLLNDAQPISDGYSGFKSVNLICALYEANKTGNTVSLSKSEQ